MHENSDESESKEENNNVDHVPVSTDSTPNKVNYTPIDETFIGQMGRNTMPENLGSISGLMCSIYMMI
jgi:hypothetical protein